MPLTQKLAVLWMGIGLCAQDAARDPKAIAEALANTKPAAVAWAAHHARALGDRTLIVPLQRALQAWREDGSSEGRAVIQHVLDALIELHAKMPAAELLPLLDDASCGTAAFVLLAQQPKQNEAELLALFRSLPPPSRRVHEQPLLRARAIGNLLCNQRTPGFARLAWQQLDLNLHVDVQDAGTANIQSLTYFARPRSDAGPEGFPPAAIHHLTNKPNPIGQFTSNQPQPKVVTLLADGPMPVFFGRMEANPSQSAFAFGMPQPDVLAWLQRLAEPKIAEAVRSVALPGTDEAAYLAAIESARTKLRTYWETLRRDLVTGKALTEAEDAGLATTVAVIVDDRRKDKSKPLPEIPAR